MPPPHRHRQVNTEIVAIQRVATAAADVQLRSLIEAHAAKTGSARAKALLADWEASKAKFWQLVPPAEKVCAATAPRPLLLLSALPWFGVAERPARPRRLLPSAASAKLTPSVSAAALAPQNTPEANPAIEFVPESAPSMPVAAAAS
jgi:glutamate synthase domain-containing protein 3